MTNPYDEMHPATIWQHIRRFDAAVHAELDVAVRAEESGNFLVSTSAAKHAHANLLELKAAQAALDRVEDAERVKKASKVLERLRAVNVDGLPPDDAKRVMHARDLLREMGAKNT